MKYNKYKNKKTVVDGISFDSIKEASRYKELKLLESKGLIFDLELQPRYILQESFKHKGKTIRKIEYIADFRYLNPNRGTIVEDTKGFFTDVFKLKEKLFLYRYGNELTFIKI